MYDREKIEEALEALSLGFSSGQAAELAGVAPSTVEHWSKGRLPLSWDARGARIAVTGHRGEAARMTETRAPYVFSQAWFSVLSTDFFRVPARNFFGFRHGRAAASIFPTFPA